MRKQTREKYNALKTSMATAYGVTDVSEQFTATEPMAQKLNDAIQASSSFLGMISMLPVVDKNEQVCSMTIAASLAGRTAGERTPTQAGAPTGRNHSCHQTNYDVAIKYNLLDVWARFADFQQRYSASVTQRIALDRLLIGFNGTSAAAETNRGANPLLQDVNTGWLHDLKTNKAEHYITEGGTTGEIRLGEGGDYANLDALVYDVKQLIKPEHRTGSEIVIIGEELVADDGVKVFAKHGHTPSEKAIGLMDKSFGGLPCYVVPGFPARGVFVTDPMNLQIAYQESAVRRANIDEPKFSQIADYISSNDSFRIGNLDGAAAVEADNVKLSWS